jgi:hypothetical protein
MSGERKEKFTPGPWVADGVIVYADVGIQPHIADLSGYTDQPEANAHLIAAAPELYAALEKAVADYGKPGGPWNIPSEPGAWINMAQKALAKARGEK